MFIKNLKKKTNEIELFNYIYAILHSKEYTDKYENDLLNNMARIPIVKKYNDFKDFSSIGEKLLKTHLEYENAKKFKIQIEINSEDKKINDKDLYKLNKMKMIQKKDKSYSDKIIYNKYISLSGIPLEAHNYKINAKSPLEWVVDKQSYNVDNKTGIINDPNIFANETMKNPAYPLELLQKVITVSLETQKLIKSLPKLDI